MGIPAPLVTTYTLRDAETGVTLAVTDDPAEIRRHILDALSYDDFPNWLNLTVATDGQRATIQGVRLFEWARRGR